MGGAVEAAALPYIDQPLAAVAAHSQTNIGRYNLGSQEARQR